MAWFAALLILCAFILLLFSYRRQRQIGFPDGRLIYQDTRIQATTSRALFDAALKLTGRPDYLLQQGALLIPVEVKSHLAGENPYDSHIYQLMAYCVLVQSHFGSRPPYGLLQYPHRTIPVDFTAERETALLNLIEEMHARRRSNDLPRSHHSQGRCQNCGYRRLCDQRL